MDQHFDYTNDMPIIIGIIIAAVTTIAAILILVVRPMLQDQSLKRRCPLCGRLGAKYVSVLRSHLDLENEKTVHICRTCMSREINENPDLYKHISKSMRDEVFGKKR